MFSSALSLKNPTHSLVSRFSLEKHNRNTFILSNVEYFNKEWNMYTKNNNFRYRNISRTSNMSDYLNNSSTNNLSIKSVLSDRVSESSEDNKEKKISRAEEFVAAVEEGEKRILYLESEIEKREKRISQLQEQIDALYDETFSGVEVKLGEKKTFPERMDIKYSNNQTVQDEIKIVETELEKINDSVKVGLDEEVQTSDQITEPTLTFEHVDENVWSDLGKSQPQNLKALIDSVDKKKWQHFQRNIHTITLTRGRIRNELKSLKFQLEEAKSVVDTTGDESVSIADQDGEFDFEKVKVKGDQASIVLISGFESFNVGLYKQTAKEISEKSPQIKLFVFSDRDLTSKRDEVESALSKADAFFGSLIFDYDQCEWLKEKIQRIPIRLIFESSLELMASTSLGSFSMSGNKGKGIPAPIKALLNKFGGREEDRMVGYLSFLKIGPKLLKFIPGKKARDLKNWLTIYGYWNQGGKENVVNMFLYLADEYLLKTGFPKVEVKETPQLGLFHPEYDGFFLDPKSYLEWHRREMKLPRNSPVVLLILYRKHVITQQKYIPQMIKIFENSNIIPLPIFINGVEAHTVVRDLITTEAEQEERKKGNIVISSLSNSAVTVDAIVSTIGFPLVGGPAGTMEGGRQAEVAKSILQSKNVPYIVSAPLLIQDIASWQSNGIQGLQSVVLYSLPELDGSIDTVPLGGLVGEGIHLVPERVRKLTSRINAWVELKRKPAKERKIAIILYGFPPGVGALGTAALLNVPNSLVNVLLRLKKEGYDVGQMEDEINGEDLIKILSELSQDKPIKMGERGAEYALKVAKGMIEKEGKKFPNVKLVAKTVEWRMLRDWLGGVLTSKMEKAWGQLYKYKGLNCDADGNSVINGIQFGNIWIGVQPALGLEGDPMRLLFERDLTPHPQYAAFYKWLQNEYKADALVHFGMHGTVEWLPGSPLGNTGVSWSDVLMGNIPNIYIYAANNPSESIIAKRRGYGTIVSYNVPPYGRSGLYKELATLKDLLNEYRDNPSNNHALREPIISTLITSGMKNDIPFHPNAEKEEEKYIDVESAKTLDAEIFNEYMLRVYDYLNVVENRLFSEGLHTLGTPPSINHMNQYLNAYFGDDLPLPLIEAISSSSKLEHVRQKFEELYLYEENNNEKNLIQSRIEEAMDIKKLLLLNTEEIDMLMKGLGGYYILPGVGGDLLRDGPGVLPTGRNIHALDPYRMPSIAAWERGSTLANNIINKHLEDHDGNYPETVAVMLWGLDAIKTRGESVAIAVALVGAKPVKEGTGRIVRFELVPLEELKRPRIDILANMSGIFRDSFANVVELLDDLFKRAAEADEPIEMNYIKKHSHELKDDGIDNSTARIFSNPAGDYGSMVNERVGASDWENGTELGDTWQSRNAFSYGRGEQGVARPEILQKLLQSTDRIVQEIDSVEYGLTDIQEYYANTGAMQKAAQTAKGGQKVPCSIVEAYGKDLHPKDLDYNLRLEYRSKLLNPKWAQKMADQGSGGAFEISQRMTALLGWGGTVDFKDGWVYDQAAQTYALDKDMAEKLRKNNPQAFNNIVKRILEAHGRGMWHPDSGTLSKLRDLYDSVDYELEGVSIGR